MWRLVGKAAGQVCGSGLQRARMERARSRTKQSGGKQGERSPELVRSLAGELFLKTRGCRPQLQLPQSTAERMGGPVSSPKETTNLNVIRQDAKICSPWDPKGGDALSSSPLRAHDCTTPSELSLVSEMAYQVRPWLQLKQSWKGRGVGANSVHQAGKWHKRGTGAVWSTSFPL